MKNKIKLVEIVSVGLASVLAGSNGCHMYKSIGAPPAVVRTCENEPDNGWIKEGCYQYRKEISVNGKNYNPKNLEDARELEKKQNAEYFEGNMDFIKKHGYPPM